MESIDSMDNKPSISCGFVETMQLSGDHGGHGRPYGITYTEEVAGSSPVPPTRLGAVPKGQPPRCNLKVLCFPRFVLDRTPSTYVPGTTESEPRYLRTKRSRGRFLPLM